jgi:hypothetical protein
MEPLCAKDRYFFRRRNEGKLCSSWLDAKSSGDERRKRNRKMPKFTEWRSEYKIQYHFVMQV